MLITVEKCGRLAAIAPKDFPQPHLGKDEERKEVEDDELQVWGGDGRKGGRREGKLCLSFPPQS